MISYAQSFEDVLLNRCFGRLPSGFYVDIGAYHPVIASVTKIFYDAGWCGINVEPGPGIQALRSERPRDINLALAVTDREGEADFWEHVDDPGTSTLRPEVADVVAGKAGQRICRRVPTLSLALLLARHAEDRHIHFLKIDAEGAEEAIIAGGDWQRFRPEVLVVESTEPYSNRRPVAKWHEILEAAAYRFAYFDGINDFWVRGESDSLLGEFAVPVNVLDEFCIYDPEVDSLKNTLAQEHDAQVARAREVGSLKGDLMQAREAAADAQVALVRLQEEAVLAERRHTEQELVLSEAQHLAALLEKQKMEAEKALVEARDCFLRADEGQRTAHADLAAAQQELVSLRQACADLERMRLRLFGKLKIDGAPRELRLVLPLARALRSALPRKGASTPAAARIGSMGSGAVGSVGSKKKKRSLRRKLKKQVKSARRRLRRSLISVTRAAAVPVILQCAKRSPKLFAKIRKDVRRKFEDDLPLPAAEATSTVPPQVLEDAILTIALHGAKRHADGTA